MFDDLLDLFDRDRKHRGAGTRKGGLRGLIQRLGGQDGERSSRDRGYHRDDDRRDDRRDDDRSSRRRRDDDWDD